MSTVSRPARTALRFLGIEISEMKISLFGQRLLTVMAPRPRWRRGDPCHQPFARSVIPPRDHAEPRDSGEEVPNRMPQPARPPVLLPGCRPVPPRRHHRLRAAFVHLLQKPIPSPGLLFGARRLPARFSDHAGRRARTQGRTPWAKR